MITGARSDPLWHAVRRIPTADKIVRNRLLNALGCQVARVLAAEALVRSRRLRIRGDMTEVEATLIRDGTAVIEGFLDEHVFDTLVDEADRGERQFFTKGSDPDKFGIVRQKIGLRKYQELFPVAVKAILGSERILRLARVAEGWSDRDDFTNQPTALTYERLEQAADPFETRSARDAEVSTGDLHADTFHYVTKAFLTLNDVTLSNGPYTYAIGSHRITFSRLVWEYRNSLRPEQYETGQYHNRVWADERRRLAIEAHPLQVRKNTLIVTNTFGFHLRGSMTTIGAVRRMFRLDFRSNPFRR